MAVCGVPQLTFHSRPGCHLFRQVPSHKTSADFRPLPHSADLTRCPAPLPLRVPLGDARRPLAAMITATDPALAPVLPLAAPGEPRNSPSTRNPHPLSAPSLHVEIPSTRRPLVIGWNEGIEARSRRDSGVRGNRVYGIPCPPWRHRRVSGR